MKKVLDKNFLAKCRLIKSGHNHDVYILENNGEKSIVHVGRDKKDSGSSLGNTNKALRFLEAQRVGFAPRVVLFDEDTDTLVQTYVAEADVIFTKLTQKQLDMFMSCLTTVHSFTVTQYQTFCEQEGFEVPKIQTPVDNFRIFGIERFEIVKSLCPDDVVIAWIETRLNKNSKLIESEVFKMSAGLRMGDIGGNLRIHNDKLFIIDWEFASLGYEHELAYIKIHSHPTDRQLAYMVQRYSHYSQISVDDLYKEIAISEQIIRVNDVIWAAMKWGQNSANTKEMEKYKNLTCKRIELYEAFVSKALV